VKTGTGAVVPVLAVGALGVGVYAAYVIAKALSDLVDDIPNPLVWIRQAGPQTGAGAALNPFKEKTEDGDWYFRSTEGSYTVPVDATPAWDADAMGTPGSYDYTAGSLDDPSDIGYSVPYMPQGIFESDAHYEAKLASKGYTRQSYKEARAASSAKWSSTWLGRLWGAVPGYGS